jgi:hypothetical protein
LDVHDVGSRNKKLTINLPALTIRCDGLRFTEQQHPLIQISERSEERFTRRAGHHNLLRVQPTEKTVSERLIDLLIREADQFTPAMHNREADKDRYRDREQCGEDSNEDSHRTISSRFS